MTDQQTTPRPNTTMTLAAGLVIALAMIAAFLWGESHDVDTTPLLAILSPIVGALFLVPKMEGLQRTTDQVARNTNGHLTTLTAERDKLAAELELLRAQQPPETPPTPGRYTYP